MAETFAHLLRGAAACAIQAPSSHNTQPWRLRRRGDTLELRLDRERHLEVVDPLRRQLLISLGCALYNARVAVRAGGWAERVKLFPRDDDRDLVATIQPELPRQATDLDRALVAAIPRRHTNRRPFLERPVAADVAEALSRAARAERTRMFRLDPQQKHTMAALVAECDRRRFADPAYREQVSAWLVPGGRWRKDGIPFAEKEFGTDAWFGVRRILDSPELPQRMADLEEDRINRAPLVAVFATQADEDIDWVDCGQALEAVLLRATQLELAAAFVDQLLEYEDLHAEVRRMTGELMPQMVVRVGYAPPLDRVAPRRDLDEVYDEA